VPAIKQVDRMAFVVLRFLPQFSQNRASPGFKIPLLKTSGGECTQHNRESRTRRESLNFSGNCQVGLYTVPAHLLGWSGTGSVHTKIINSTGSDWRSGAGYSLVCILTPDRKAWSLFFV